MAEQFAEILPAERTYEETREGLWWYKPSKDGVTRTRLTNFTARIVAEVLCDDGAEVARMVELEVSLLDKETRHVVPVADFEQMNWVGSCLGPRAIIYPGGYGIKEHTRTAIQELSGPYPTRAVFAHLGWAQIDGKWVFLHADGAIGAEGVVDGAEVSVSGTLTEYRLPAPPEDESLKR
ncbi:MAG TPA: hypothetical protein VKR22_03845, partial [Acidimicrobiales bacterium]|nr:hypothetical protein [Acidimicrobiales bacterium]